MVARLPGCVRVPRVLGRFADRAVPLGALAATRAHGPEGFTRQFGFRAAVGCRDSKIRSTPPRSSICCTKRSVERRRSGLGAPRARGALPPTRPRCVRLGALACVPPWNGRFVLDAPNLLMVGHSADAPPFRRPARSSTATHRAVQSPMRSQRSSCVCRVSKQQWRLDLWGLVGCRCSLARGQGLHLWRAFAMPGRQHFVACRRAWIHLLRLPSLRPQS